MSIKNKRIIETEVKSSNPQQQASFFFCGVISKGGVKLFFLLKKLMFLKAKVTERERDLPSTSSLLSDTTAKAE